MPSFVGTLPVASFDEETNTLKLQIGAETFEKSLTDLAALAGGTDAIDTLWGNIAISAKLDGVDVANPVELVTHVNRSQYKYFR